MSAREPIADRLRILHLEGDAGDAARVRRALERERIPCRIRRVETREEFVTSLNRGNVDLILSDFSLPDFDGLSALAMVRRVAEEIPFILVSGALDEEAAIESLRRGATDFVLKTRLSRLVPSVVRAVRERQERRRLRSSEAFLGESAARFRTVFEEMPVGMAMFTEELRLRGLNPAHCRMGCWKREELIGRDYRELIHPDDRAQFARAARELFHGDRQTHEFEQRYLGPDERTVWGAVTASLTHFEADQPVVGLAVVLDRSEKKNLEEQLRQAQKLEAIGRLAGGVAHDFNNLLSVIMGYSEVALQKLGPGHSLSASIEEVRRAGERASILTRQLLAFSRKQVLQPVNLDLNEIVKGMGGMLRRVIGEDIELVTRPAPDLDRVECDPGQIEQIIMNLVVNARDAMPTGGRLTLETANVVHGGERSATLAITDTGHGMDAATRSRIFEPFFTTKGPGKGTGLGLSMVYGIVNQSGGDIGVRSAPGHGATFEIRFPRATGTAVGVARSARRSSPGTGTETILVVEDEPDVRDLLRFILEGAGYEVLHTGDAAEAVERCRTHSGTIDLLLTDVIMPKMSGRRLAETVSAIRPDLKILYMSGYTDEAIVRHGILDASRIFLEKPIRLATLLDKVRSTLDG